MPYDPNELNDISKELQPGDDPTLAAASKVTGVDEDNENPQYHPVIGKNEKVLVRDAGSTLNWKNYHFEVKFEDGTQQEFVFTAKDDGDAQKKVADRIKSTTDQKGTYKLSQVETPKEVFAGEFGTAEKTVDSNEPEKADEKNAEAEKK